MKRERESEPFILFPLSLSRESKNLSGVLWKASLFQCVYVFTTVYKNLTRKRKFSVQAALSTFYSLVTYYSFTDQKIGPNICKMLRNFSKFVFQIATFSYTFLHLVWRNLKHLLSTNSLNTCENPNEFSKHK